MNDTDTLSAAERDAVYRCIFARRDIRGQFLPDPVDEAVLARVLRAAHHAPSVGFMQPWDFLVIRDEGVRRRVHAAFTDASAEAAEMFEDERRRQYQRLKLEGILDAPLNICVTCDRSRMGPVVLGRTHQPDMDLFSAVCAVQNLWLAARAENLGVGWVSIIDPARLRAVLGIPPAIEIVAYLCVGTVSHFPERPELETAGWQSRLDLSQRVWFDGWNKRTGDESLTAHIDTSR